MDEKLIIVTGFGPFRNIAINPSWEAVKELPTELEENGCKYKIEKFHVPVMYDEVDKIVEKIWEKKPYLVIHCGVHELAKHVHLEKVARNAIQGYDVAGRSCMGSKICLPNNGSCEELTTKFDVDKISEKLNKANGKKNFKPSTDVGKYLCGYIYLKSLDRCCDSTLFVHVPPCNDQYSIPKLTQAIISIIKECIEEIRLHS